RFEVAVPAAIERPQIVQIFANGQPAGQLLIFRDVADVRQLAWRQRSRVHAQNRGGAERWLDQIHQHLDGGRLPGAVAADQRKRTAFGNLEANAVQGVEPAVSLPDVVYLD